MNKIEANNLRLAERQLDPWLQSKYYCFIFVQSETYISVVAPKLFLSQISFSSTTTTFVITTIKCTTCSTKDNFTVPMGGVGLRFHS